MANHELTVAIEANVCQTSGYVDRFNSFGGQRFLRQTLLDAGITRGNFRYILGEWFKSSGFTKPVQPRSFSGNRIILWLKPGGNGSAVKGTLVVDRADYAAEDVFNALKDAVHSDKAGETEDTAEDVEVIHVLEDAKMALLLTAINTVGLNYHASRGKFDRNVITHLRGVGWDTDSEGLVSAYKAAFSAGMATDKLLAVVITPSGQRWLELHTEHEAKTMANQPAALPAAPTGQESVVDLIERQQAKLKRLMELPTLLKSCRAKQSELQTKIDALKLALESEQNAEKKIMAEFDTDAVRLLLEGS